MDLKTWKKEQKNKAKIYKILIYKTRRKIKKYLMTNLMKMLAIMTKIVSLLFSKN
jgi:Pyruvate/2-oxoacid:ferredoxin oxidoreductase gamma subunit